MKLVAVFCVFLIFFKICNAENEIQAESPLAGEQFPVPKVKTENDYEESTTDEIEKIIESIEETTELLKHRENKLLKEDPDKLYDELAEKIDILLEVIENYNAAYSFLLAKGIDRVVSPNIGITYTPIQSRLLILLKTLFDVAPTSTKVVIPLNIVDKLLDIFEHNSNLALKAYAMDILYEWLPENPKVQVRVMKLKGLEPFYHQIAKLDVSVIHTLLDLFNKILIEHMYERNERVHKTRADFEKLDLYKKIGLIERMSTPAVCDGLFKIFENAWMYQNEGNMLLAPVLSLIRNVKAFCLSSFKNHTKAGDLFMKLATHIKNLNSDEYFSKYRMNLTEIENDLKEYVENLQPDNKEEL